jgi:hypothetical protein
MDRRISVAPMMDWTDETNPSNKIIALRSPRKACHLYVSSTRADRDSVSAPLPVQSLATSL